MEFDSESIEIIENEISDFKKINKEFHNSMIFLDEEETDLPDSLRKSLSTKKNSKFFGFIERYMTHKFFFNLLFVLKVALGNKLTT